MTSAKRIALERIGILMEKAREVSSKDVAQANRYAELARKIAMRGAFPFPKKWKRNICKGCGTFLVTGKNYRVRTRDGRVIATCLNCNRTTRIPFHDERHFKRKEKFNKRRSGEVDEK